ncbi:tRNA lysidine(34) synthetase TilS [Candidatus Vidania fulgoroideorum]
MKNLFLKKLKFLVSKKKNENIAISYSGGLDSNILLEICEKIYKNLTLIHINHRNKNSNKIEKKCIKIAKIKKINILTSKINILEKYFYKNLNENFYRKERYKTLLKIMKKKKIKKLLVCHTLDDLIETFFINITRGTGINGVCSLREKIKKGNYEIIRPMLQYDRNFLIKNFLKKKIIISFDKSNLNLKIKRNFLRKKLNIFNNITNFNIKILKFVKNCFDSYICLRDLAYIDICKTKMLINEIIKYKKNRIFNILTFYFKKKNFKIPSKSWLKELLKQMKSKSKNFFIIKNKNFIFNKNNKLFFKKFKIKINKYGGSSLSDLNKIKNILINLKKKIKIGYKLIVIASAMGESTDILDKDFFYFCKKKKKKFYDLFISTGEIKSISIICQIASDLKIKVDYLTSWQLPIKSIGEFSNSKISNIKCHEIYKKFIKKDLIIIPGFQAINEKKEMVTLGRGGSDYTAIEICKFIKIKECYFYKDVLGIYNADPNKFKNCNLIKKINYLEILQMSSIGEKILQLNCVVNIIKNNIKCYLIKSNKKFLNMKKEKTKSTTITGNYISKILKKKRFFYNIQKCYINYITFKKYSKLRNILSYLENKNVDIDNFFLFKKKKFFLEFSSRIKLKKFIKKKYIKLNIFGIGINFYNNNFIKINKFIIKKNIKIYSVSNSEMCIKYIFKKKYKKFFIEIIEKIIKKEM